MWDARPSGHRIMDGQGLRAQPSCPLQMRSALILGQSPRFYGRTSLKYVGNKSHLIKQPAAAGCFNAFNGN